MNLLSLGSIIGNVGPTELIIVLLIVLLLFGGKKLPELARSLGKSMNEFRKGKDEGNQSADSKFEDKLSEKKTDDKPKQAV